MLLTPSLCHKRSHLLGPPPPSSMTYFMGGPWVQLSEWCGSQVKECLLRNANCVGPFKRMAETSGPPGGFEVSNTIGQPLVWFQNPKAYYVKFLVFFGAEMVCLKTQLTLMLTLTDPHDAYENLLSAVGIETWKTRTTTNSLTTCAIGVYTMLRLNSA